MKTQHVALTIPIPQADLQIIEARAEQKGLPVEDYILDMAIRDIIASGVELPAELRTHRPYRACAVQQGT